MNKEENVFIMAKELAEENEQLKRDINQLIAENASLKEDLNGDWMHSKVYKDAIKDAKEMKDKYESAYKEMCLLKADFKKNTEKIMNAMKERGIIC